MNAFRRLGWATFDNLARERSFTEEQKHWLDGLRSMKVDYTGIMQTGVHFAPYLSKASLESQLEVYEEQIGAVRKHNYVLMLGIWELLKRKYFFIVEANSFLVIKVVSLNFCKISANCTNVN